MSSAITKPSRASSMAGLRICASVKRPEPYFSSASCQPGDRAGHADAERGIARLVAVGLAVGPKKNILRDRTRCGLAIIDGGVFVARRRMNHHEAAAADVSGPRIGDGEREAGGDRGIDRVAALPQDVGADLRGDPFLRHHQAMLGRNGANGGEIGGRVNAAFLRKGRRPVDKRKYELWQLPGATGSKRPSSKIRRSWSLCDAWQQPPASVTHAIWVRI